jgi:hypothetical protein
MDMAYVEEPSAGLEEFSEIYFQKYIKEEIENILIQMKSMRNLEDFFILEQFGLDIAVFLKFNSNTSICFFELKAFKGSRQGGVGFGNGRGKKPQVDLLLIDDSRLSIADSFIRWILVDARMSAGEKRYVFFDNMQAKNSAMGGVSKSKHNNFRVNALMQNAITWDELSECICDFLASQNAAYTANQAS